MSIPKECIIIGGGYSIREGIKLGLKKHIKDKFVILCNYAFKHFDGTLVTFLDKDFYVPEYAKEKKGKNPDIYNELKKLSLLIGVNFNNGINEFILSNTIMVKRGDCYVREQSLIKGFYHKVLTGIFSLTLASFLMNFEGKIYLLGFDEPKRTKEDIINKKKPKTHYYEDIKHRGIGEVYIFHKSKERFLPFTKEEKLKIYNVSMISTINCFEKIDYPTFFKKLNNVVYNQEELRKEIKLKLSS